MALDEAAQLVASAVFPTAVQGLRDVNVKLWEFEKIQWKLYTDILTDVVQRNSITAISSSGSRRLPTTWRRRLRRSMRCSTISRRAGPPMPPR